MAKKRPKEEEVDDENRENGSYEDAELDDEGDYEEEHDDDNNDRRSGRNKKKKKNKKHKQGAIMDASGQTEAERRVLRHNQRQLHQDIVMGAGSGGGNAAAAGEGEEDGNDGSLTNLRKQNNALWNQVHYTREAVLDSENVDLIANKAAREAEKLVQVPRYDAIRLAQSLVKKGSVHVGNSSAGPPQFNWRGFGIQVGICFNAPPQNVSFLYGPLDAEYTPKERKKPERRKKSQEELESANEEEEEPEDVDQTGKKKSDGNELSAVEKHMTVIYRTLKHKSKEQTDDAQVKSQVYETQLTQEEGIDDPTVLLKQKRKFIQEHRQVSAVSTLFNPHSFTQTVENIFHFSFLVKDTQAGIRNRTAKVAEEFGGVEGMELEPGPVIRPAHDADDGEKIGKPTQAIVSLNMKDWRDMCNAYEVQESHVPHRVDGKVAKEERKKKKSRKSH